MDTSSRSTSYAQLSSNFSRRISRVRRSHWVSAALLVLIASTLNTFRQSPAPDPIQSPSLFSFEWWRYPLERNPHKRLPEIKCDLNAIFALPDGQNVWAVGNLGMIAHSADDGHEWSQQRIVIQPRPSPSPSPKRGRIRTSRSGSGQDKNFNQPFRKSKSRAASPISLREQDLGGAAGTGAFLLPVSTHSIEQQQPPKQPTPTPSLPAATLPSTGFYVTGIVYELVQKEPTHLSGVKVTILREESSADTTDDKGVFKLNSRIEFSEGQSVRLQFTKRGYRTASYYATVGPKGELGDFKMEQDLNASAVSPTPTPTPINTPTPNVASATTPTPTPTPEAAVTISKENLIAVYFADAQRGWTLNRMGERFTTTDGGKTWTPQEADPQITPFLPLRSARIGDGGVIESCVQDGTGSVFLAGNLAPVSMPGASAVGVFNNSADVYVIGQTGAFYWAPPPAAVLKGATTPARRFSRVSLSWNQDLHGAHFLSDNSGWIVGSDGLILHTQSRSAQALTGEARIAGFSWQRLASGSRSSLRAIHSRDTASPANQLPGANLQTAATIYAVGTEGTILRSIDGGVTWRHATQGTEGKAIGATGVNSRWPAPWYYLACLTSLLLLAPALRRRPEDDTVAADSIEERGASDRPIDEGDPDPLDFRALALSLSRFLRNENTLPPLTLAITGEWGVGKSSLMNLLRSDLRRYGFRPVWFNAWHHQKEEHLLASLLQNVRRQSVPLWWTPEGFMFRLRLLVIRGWRHWLPALALIFAFSFSVSWVIYHPAAVSNLARQVNAASAKIAGGEAPQRDESKETSQVLAGLLELIKLPAALATEGSLLALLFSSIGVIASALRGMKAFGVSPGSLMATMSHGMKVRDLDAQTSFRQRFATEFRDVTKALGARSTPIFIDDLDRCRPENVLEVLEAINFLVSSGDCYVVMGMARERVERCVGLSFRSVAHEMIDLAPDKGAAQTPAEQSRQQRRIFARQYLDKLINIEVPVPTPGAEQTLRLIVSDHATPPSSLSQSWRTAQSFLSKLWPVLLIAVVIFIGYNGGRDWGSSTIEPATAPTTPTGATAPTDAPIKGGQAPRSVEQNASPPSSKSSSEAAPLPSPARRTDQSPELVSPHSLPQRASLWPLALMILLLLGLAIWYFTQRRDLIVKDSPEFEIALKIWHSQIHSDQTTPRSIKRFMNRLRYLAMRQRPLIESAPRWREMIAPFAGKLGIQQPPPAAVEAAEMIPEHAMVALAALQQIKPALLHEREEWLFKYPSNPPDHMCATEEDKRLMSALLGRIGMHAVTFGDWKEVGEYRHLFLRMTSEVQAH